MKRSLKAVGIAFLFTMYISIISCDFPYAPKPQPAPGVSISDSLKPGGSVGSGIVYPVNIAQQVCNPSISQNDLYNGSLLWLGFNKMRVRIPNGSTFDTVKVAEHDRLTVTDTGNMVRWHIMISELENKGEFQCPEWSAHPDYIACLTGTILQPYNGWVIRVSDKKGFRFAIKVLEEFSTPHLWVADTAKGSSDNVNITYESNGFAKKESVVKFFGTDSVVIVYSNSSSGGYIYYVNYAADSVPVPVRILKPAGQEGAECASPLISPDGNYVTYHCYTNSAQGNQYSSYIQRLKPDSKPILISNEASDPHWWVDKYNNNTYYIVYTVTKGAYFSEYDYLDPSIEKNNVAGVTLKVKLKGTAADVPSHIETLSLDNLKPDTLVKLPFKGGLSKDGYFLGTAYKYAYIMKLK